MQVHKTAILNHGPEIGIGTKIGEYTIIHGSMVKIGENCDIGERVSINAADSHLKCIGLSDEIEYLPIEIGDNVFIGAGAIILGGCQIGHHSVIGAGSIIPKNTDIEPYSLVMIPLRPGYKGGSGGANLICKTGYFHDRISDSE